MTMELSPVYSPEFPLFGGELLELADSELYDATGPAGLAKPLSWSDEATFAHDPLLDSSHADETGMFSLYDDTWLDQKMDFLEMMCNPSFQEKSYGQPTDKPMLETSARAVELLKQAAEESAELLSTAESEIMPLAIVDLAQNDTEEGLDLLELLGEGGADDPLSIIVDPANILSHISPEDIEDILSSGPSSPYSEESILSEISTYEPSEVELSLSSEDNTLIEVSVPDSLPVDSDLARLLLSVESNDSNDYSESIASDSYSPISTSRAKPYDRKQDKNSRSKTGMTKEEKQLDRRLRKKQQNKDAATRYRVKKRAEADMVNGEVDELETRNTELKDTVAQMTGEIQYLKNLLAEVYKVKELKLKIRK